MTGSTPPWKRRTWTKRRDAVQGPSEAVRDDERGSFPEAPGGPGEAASLESADGHEATGDLAAAAAADAVDAVEVSEAEAASGTETRAQLARRRASAVKDGVRRSGDVARASMARSGSVARLGVTRSAAAAKAGIGYLADQIIKNAPRVPVRDLATLRRQFPGLTPEQLADKLVTGAANATSTVGAGVGAAAMLPVPPAMPTELATEITGVAAIELKLIAELYEVYGVRPPGGLKDRTTTYLSSWSDERGIDVRKPATINVALGGQMKRELRQQIMKRMVRNLPMLTPFLIGAAVGAAMNRRDTRKLAERIRKDLRAVQVPWDALADLPPLEAPENPLELEA
ncbi:hypothetical protein [Streptomyces sp. VRA16 Mangrove soil]|uniref:hypothetical protein n=1 Tax=Streptomyces sp. VRA16 Mangrove soil TaxID=2817434 RepID=UPI001A9D5544|nr:hypothetical protein [Streptomyces sp. VRA16 Mangrove soil]MBO1335738.1 hypothetical protein [Streptomyces sp. VRA16 Mangrove soil]